MTISGEGGGENGTFPAPFYRLARGAPDTAPILRGGLHPNVSGYTRVCSAPHEMARELRRALGMTQAALGAALGVSTDTIRRWETTPDHPRHEPITARRLTAMRRLLTKPIGSVNKDTKSGRGAA